RDPGLQREGNAEGGEEGQGNEVPAPQAEAPFPLRVAGQSHDGDGHRGYGEDAVAARLTGAPPGDEAGNSPDPERREEEQTTGGIEEEPEQGPKARRPDPEEPVARRLRILRSRLVRGGEGPGRPEAGEVVDEKQGHRRERAEAEPGEPGQP